MTFFNLFSGLPTVLVAIGITLPNLMTVTDTMIQVSSDMMTGLSIFLVCLGMFGFLHNIISD